MRKLLSRESCPLGRIFGILHDLKLYPENEFDTSVPDDQASNRDKL